MIKGWHPMKIGDRVRIVLNHYKNCEVGDTGTVRREIPAVVQSKNTILLRVYIDRLEMCYYFYEYEIEKL